MEFDARLLQRLATGFHATAACGREPVQAGPFAAWFHPTSNDPLDNVAAPIRDADDWASAVARLRDVFGARGRPLRVEHFAELHPDLGPALEAAGVQRAMTAPAMVLTAERFTPRPATRPTTYMPLDANDAGLAEGFLDMQSQAFGMARERIAAWKSLFLAGLGTGTLRAACAVEDDHVVSGATIQVAGKVGELAGVGTRPDRQGQGLAGEVCSRLLQQWFDDGRELCWLSADEAAQGLYSRLGFRVVGTQLNHGSVDPDSATRPRRPDLGDPA